MVNLKKHPSALDSESPFLGKITQVNNSIETSDAITMHLRPYPVLSSERAVIQKEVAVTLEPDVIRHSASPWSSPVVLVRKRDGTRRSCVHYRRSNKITMKDVYPLLRIDDSLDCVYGFKSFSSIGLISGYWQITVDERDRE